MYWTLFLAAVCAGSPGLQDPPSSLVEITSDLSILARLVNGIAIQNGFREKTLQFNDVVSELLAIESGDGLKKLKTFDLDATSVEEHLDKILNDVIKLKTNPVKEATKVKEGLLELESWKEKDLTTGNDANIDDFIQKSKELTGDVFWSRVPLELSKFANISHSLTDLGKQELSSAFSVLSSFSNAFKSIEQVSKSSFLSDLEALLDYEDRLKNLFAITDKYKVLDPILTISEIAKKYKAKEEIFGSLSVIMSGMSQDITVLMPLVKKHSDFHSVSQSLLPIPPVVSAFYDRKSPVTVTVGLPGGAKDLVLIPSDIESAWLKEKIGEGKDISGLAPALAPLVEFGKKMAQLEEDWKTFRSVPDQKTLADKMHQLYENMSREGKALDGVSNLESSITTVSNAVKDLKKMTGSPNFEEFQKVYDYAKKVSDQSVAVKKAFGGIVKSGTKKDDILAVISNLIEVAKKVASDIKPEEMLNLVTEVRAVPGFNDLEEMLSAAVRELAPFSSEKLAKFVINKPDWSVVKQIQTSLQGTGLSDALSALKTASYNQENIDQLLGFGTNIRSVNEKDIGYVKTLMAVIPKLKSKLAEVEIAAMALSSNSTRRRRANAVDVGKFERVDQVSREFGTGVNELRKMSKVLEKKADVLSAAESSDTINSVVSSTVPTWSTDNRVAMKTMLTQLEGLEKYAKTLKDKKDLLAVGGVFGKASEIGGVPIDTKLLAEPMLQQLPAPNQKPFRELSSLQLKYTSAEFKEASLALHAIREFFDGAFGISRSADGSVVGSKLVSTEDGFGKLIIVIVAVVGALILVGAVVFVAIKIWKKKAYNLMVRKALKDPQTWALLLRREENKPVWISDTLTASPLYVHIDKGNFAAFKRCIKNGGYVDARTQGAGHSATLLHFCVERKRTEFIKVLIENGATTFLVDQNYMTAKQLAVKQKKTKIVKVFEKYEKQKKKYLNVLPKPLLSENFLFGISGDIKDNQYKRGEFMKKFNHHWEFDAEKLTHFVVETDEAGVWPIKECDLPRLFSPYALMRHEWMRACLDDDGHFEDYHDYQVTAVSYFGVVYDSVDRIKEYYNRSRVPMLVNAGMCFISADGDWSVLMKVSKSLGATIYPIDCMVAQNHKMGHLFYNDTITRELVIYRPKDWNYLSQNWAHHIPDTRYSFMSCLDLIRFFVQQLYSIKNPVKELQMEEAGVIQMAENAKTLREDEKNGKSAKNKKKAAAKKKKNKKKAKKGKKDQSSAMSMTGGSSGKSALSRLSKASTASSAQSPSSTASGAQSPSRM